ncbi:hypothetical protein D3C81_1184000 [compost metagenome]
MPRIALPLHRRPGLQLRIGQQQLFESIETSSRKLWRLDEGKGVNGVARLVKYRKVLAADFDGVAG